MLRPHVTTVFVRMVSAVLYQEALIASQQIQPVSVRQEARVQVFITHTETYKNITVRAVLERLAKACLDVLLECSARMATAYLNLVILARTAIVASVFLVGV